MNDHQMPLPPKTSHEWAAIMSALPIDFETDGSGTMKTTRYDSAESVGDRLAELDAQKGKDWAITVHRSWVEIERVAGVGWVCIRFFRTAKKGRGCWVEYHHYQSD